MQAIARFHLGEHRHIRMFGQQRRQGFLGIAQTQVHGNAGVARTQAGDHRHHQVGAIRRHFQAPGEQLAVGLQQGLRLVDQPEDSPRDGRQACALLGQFHPTCGAAQQRDLVVLLKRLDMPGHRRLADKQPSRRAGKTALTGHGIECTQLEQIHSYRPH